MHFTLCTSLYALTQELRAEEPFAMLSGIRKTTTTSAGQRAANSRHKHEWDRLRYFQALQNRRVRGDQHQRHIRPLHQNVPPPVA